MTKPTTIEQRASLVLRAGIWSSGILMTLGVILALLQGVGPLDGPAGGGFPDIIRFALAQPLHPLTLLYGGLLVLMFTPILRVVAALTGFAQERDRRFVLVSLIVLLLLLGEVSYALFSR